MTLTSIIIGLIDTEVGMKIWEKQSQFADIQSIIQRLVKCTFFERLGWRRFPQLETTLKKLRDIVRDIKIILTQLMKRPIIFWVISNGIDYAAYSRLCGIDWAFLIIFYPKS